MCLTFKTYFASTNELSTLFPGKVIIIGGYGDKGLLKSAEGFGALSPPDVPVAVADFSLVEVGSRLFMCGGRAQGGRITDECYMLDAHENPQTWRAAGHLPRKMAFHSGVAIGTRIWYVYNSVIYTYETRSDVYEQQRLPFYVDQAQCAVSNNTHSFIIGVGKSRTEIWMNTIGSDPSQWNMVGSLPIYTLYVSCTWLEDKIYILGGRHNPGSRNETFALNANTFEVKQLANLNYERSHAQALVIDCKPAVVGGRARGKGLSSIEVYDSTSDIWKVHERSLETARFSFGLAQLKE